jgi:uncharacterized membrane protein YfhO
VLARGFNYVTFSVQAPADGMLVVNEASFPGWIAEVDGSSVPLLHVNSMMQGLRLKAGDHRIELRFRPLYFLLPLWLAILSLAAVALVIARQWARRVIQSRATPGATRVESPVR